MARPPYRILLLLLVTMIGRLRPDVSAPRHHVSADLVGLRPDPGSATLTVALYHLVAALVGLRPDFTCQKAV